MTTDLDNLLQNTHGVWKGNHPFSNTAAGISTGYTQLDNIIPGKGWPVGAVTELIPKAMGIGELRLLLPAIRETTRQRQRVLMINSPYQPYTPALVQAGIDLEYLFLISPKKHEDSLWAAEKALYGRVCKILLLWLDYLGNHSVDNATVRRLQVAARTGGVAAILYRSPYPLRDDHTEQSNWAALRLRLNSADKGFLVEVLKLVGSHARPSMILDEAI